MKKKLTKSPANVKKKLVGIECNFLYINLSTPHIVDGESGSNFVNWFWFEFRAYFPRLVNNPKVKNVHEFRFTHCFKMNKMDSSLSQEL